MSIFSSRSLRRESSESHLTIQKSMFDQLENFVHCFEDLRFFVSLFVDDSRRTDYPPLQFRPLKFTAPAGEQGPWEGFG